MKVYLGADHAGHYLKENIKKVLQKRGIDVEDLSPEYRDGDDYPDYALSVGEKVAKKKDSFGILVCGTGTGMCIAANKVKGIRAAAVFDKYGAKKSREDNDSNVLCLRGRRFFTRSSLKLVNVWLNTKFSNSRRHKRRIEKISKYELRKK